MLDESQLAATLGRYKPSAVTAFVGDEPRKVHIPNVRKRWVRVVASLQSIGAWSKVELLDKSGALMHTIDNAEPAGDLVDIPMTARTAELQGLLTIVLKAQREAMAFKNEETQGLFRAMSEMQREQTQAVKALTGLYQEQLKVVRETEQERTSAMVEAAQAAAQDGDQMKQFMEALPLIMQALPALRAMLTGQSGAPGPSNGARK